MKFRKIILALVRLGVLHFQKLWWRFFRGSVKDVRVFTSPSQCEYKFIVIYASYLASPDVYARDLLSLFKQKGGYVIFITNHHSPRPDRISPDLADAYINNGGYGRDMGQYQSGTRFVKEQFKEEVPEKIIYCNDSFFYVERGDHAFLDELLNSQYDMVGTFENPGPERVRTPWFVSSWLFSVSAGLFRSKNFSDFFRRYKAINNKLHAVRHGEVALTRVALDYSGKIRAIYNNKYLLAIFRESVAKNGATVAASLIPAPMCDEYEAQFQASATRPHFVDYVERNLYRFSPTHIFHFILLKETDFPFVKKDLFWAGWAQYDQLSELESIIAESVSQETASKLSAYFRLRGRLSDASFWVRFWAIVGLK